MRWHARSLVGLEHVISEGVLFGQGEVRLNVGRNDIHEWRVAMRIRRTLGGWITIDQIRAVHLSAIVRGFEGRMAVIEIVVLCVSAVCAEVNGAEPNGPAERVQASLSNVWAPADQDRILEKIVRSAVLLKDHHHVLDCPRD